MIGAGRLYILDSVDNRLSRLSLMSWMHVGSRESACVRSLFVPSKVGVDSKGLRFSFWLAGYILAGWLVGWLASYSHAPPPPHFKRLIIQRSSK